MLTKQDLQKIITLISSQSVKDSRFPMATSAVSDDNTQIPVLQNGKNRLMKLDMLVKYVNSNTSLSEMPISVDWSDKDTLGDLLGELYECAVSGSYVDDEGNRKALIAANVGYTKQGTEYTNVKWALDDIINTLDVLSEINDNISNKADLLEETGMLTPSQWPNVVVIGLITPNEQAAEHIGDVYLDASNNHLMMVTGIDENNNTQSTDLGSPRKGILYCDKDTGLLYRWDPLAGQSGKFVSVGGGSSTSVINEVVEGSQEAVTSGAVAAVLTDYDDRLSVLEDAANPVKYMFSATPSLLEYTGEEYNIKLSASVKKGSEAVGGHVIILSLNGESQTSNNVSSFEYTVPVTDRNGTGYLAQARYYKDGNQHIETARVKIMHKFRVGFSTAYDIDDLDVQSLQWSVLKDSFPNEVLGITNPPANSETGDYYLWIAYDDSLGDSITVKSSGFDVSLTSIMEKDGYCILRSTGPVESGIHNYTISK